MRLEEAPIRTPLKAIRAKCLECQSGSYRNVRNCEFKNCPLFGFRMGKNPLRRGKGRLFNFAKKTSHSTHEFCEKNGIPEKDEMVFCGI